MPTPGPKPPTGPTTINLILHDYLSQIRGGTPPPVPPNLPTGKVVELMWGGGGGGGGGARTIKEGKVYARILIFIE